MSLLRKLLVEPAFRIAIGRPLKDGIPLEAEAGVAEPVSGPGYEGLVVTAAGVGGFDLCGTALRYVMGAQGQQYAFHNFPWGHGLGRWFADLTDVNNRDAKAAQLADAVRQFKSWKRNVPVFLVGKSGGSGLVVKALERLEERSVERAILLAPALSPDYDLSAALRALSHDMIVFWSPLDVFLLGLGTHVFGTADRIRTASAGLVGFRVPTLPASTPDAAQHDFPYAKLRQVKWSVRMVAAGHLGGHFGADSPVFLRNYVVPLLRTEAGGPC